MMWKLVLPVLAAVFAVVSAGLIGGFEVVDPNDAGVKNALNAAVVSHNRRTNDAYFSQVSEVVKVERQVVAGLKYRISVKMGKTSCRKENVNEECAVHEDLLKAEPFQCTFTVWSRPWLNDITVLKEECRADPSTL